MASRPITPLIVLTLLFTATIAVVRWSGTPARTLEPEVRTELPASVDGWTGSQVLFCQNEQCLAAVPEDAGGGLTVCPKCGGPLDGISLGEKKILPADTLIRKRRYRRVNGTECFVTLVVTGDQRASIHRPQWCLPAQGYSIDGSRVLRVPLGGTRNLDVMLLDLSGPISSARKSAPLSSAYAYWFVGSGFTTPYHAARLVRGGWDSVFRGANQRWAFISVAASRTPGSDRHEDQLKRFIAALYPLIETPQ